MPGRMLVRFILLQKRLLRKYSFLLMLCLAPLFAAGVGQLSKEESGIATIALYLPEGDLVAKDVAGRLLSGEHVLRYLSCEGETEARQLVEAGAARGYCGGAAGQRAPYSCQRDAVSGHLSLFFL